MVDGEWDRLGSERKRVKGNRNETDHIQPERIFGIRN